MGVLIEGAWREEDLLQELGRAGEFHRADSAFRVVPTLGRSSPGPPLQQTDRRIHAQRVYDHDFCHGVPAAIPEDATRAMARRDQ
jgi:hypothetical protein